MTSIIDDDNNNNVNKNNNDNNNSAAINTITRIESNIVSIIDQSSSFTPNLYVKQSQLGEVVGDGLFTKTYIPTAGIHLCDYTGTVYSTSDAIKREDHSYLMRLGEQKYVDALSHKNVLARYINDCRNSNLYNVKFVKLPNENKAKVITTRAIFPDEEIFVNYGKWYWAGFAGGKAMKLPIRKSVELLNMINMVGKNQIL